MNNTHVIPEMSSRCLEEHRSRQTTLASTPHCTVSGARARLNGSGPPSKKPPSKSKSTSKTPSEHVR